MLGSGYSFLDEFPKDNVLEQFDMVDRRVISTLGSGSFSIVLEVEHLPKSRDRQENQSPPRGRTKSKRFAIKRMSEESIRCQNRKSDALHCLLSEAVILAAKLPEHKNAISLHGVSSNLFAQPEEGFLVLELLTDTRDQRMHRWKNRRLVEEIGVSALLPRCLRFGEKQKNVEEQHLQIKDIGVVVADVMAFIHRNSILYRDLKPANIGFDADGVLRIFNFGLAREFDQSEPKNLTNKVGTPR